MDERYVRPYIAALLAKVLFELGRHDEAEQIVSLAAEIASDDDVETQVVLRSVEARLSSARGQAAEARALSREALELAQETDSPVLHADTLVDLAELFEEFPSERVSALEKHAPSMSRNATSWGSSASTQRWRRVPSRRPEPRGVGC